MLAAVCATNSTTRCAETVLPASEPVAEIDAPPALVDDAVTVALPPTVATLVELSVPRVVENVTIVPSGTGDPPVSQRTVNVWAVGLSGISALSAAGVVNANESALTVTACVAVSPSPVTVSVSLPGWVIVDVKVARPWLSVVSAVADSRLPVALATVSGRPTMPRAAESASVTV